MDVNIEYFGMLSEITRCSEETISLSENRVSDLLALLFRKYPALEQVDFQLAQNGEIRSEETFISHRNLALLPPFSGG